MADGIVLGIPASVINLVQQGLLERAFHDGLYPAMQYRAEATAEEWPANSGTETFMSRAGLLKPIVKPLVPGNDPVPQAVSFEQWVAKLLRFSGTIDTHIPTAITANANLFMRNVHQLGLQAGQSLNRIPRDELFKAYLSGSTVLLSATASGDTSIRVASLNGFTEVVSTGVSPRPQAVSPSAPLQITIGTVTKNVIGFSPDDPNDPFGPGTLVLSATVGSTIAARSSVLSAARPRIIRSGGGSSVDALSAGDTFTLQDAINAVNILREDNVQPHDDGFYHAHISPAANGQVFADPVFQRLNQSLPEHVIYKEGFIGTISGIMFFMNNEAPNKQNSGDRVATGTNAFYSSEIGAETTNEAGVDVGRIIVTGKGCVYERYLDESQYVTEAGITGKIGEFDVVNNGLVITLERIRLILRAPIDRIQDVVAASWSISTCFPIPTDVSSGGPSRYKRAVIIEHSL